MTTILVRRARLIALLAISLAAAGRTLAAEPLPATASAAARELRGWVAASGDAAGQPFIIVDKADARVFVFGTSGRLLGEAPALLGLAIGDTTAPGIGSIPLGAIRPADRTTPAGRFVAGLDRNAAGKPILWVDYDAAISLHAVVTGKPKERRLARLATPSVTDNRISYGCINVPAEFFERTVRALFEGRSGIVYILPEVRRLREVFSMD